MRFAALAFLLLTATPAFGQVPPTLVVYPNFRVSWQPGPVNEDGSNKPDGFRVWLLGASKNECFEPPTAPSDCTLLGETTFDVLEFIDTATQVVPGTVLCYQVKAFNVVAESPPALTLEGQRYACLAAPMPTINITVPAGRTVLISRRGADTSSVVSALVNKDDVVSINDSDPNAPIKIKAPAGRSVLLSRRSTNTSSVIAILANKSDEIFVNGIKQ